MKLYYLDTNVLLRYFLADIVEQYEIARKYLERAKKGEIKLFVCQSVILESEYILSKNYKIPRIEIADILGKVINVPYLEVEDRLAFQENLIAYSHSKVGLVDCFLHCKAKLKDAEVLSFDKDLKKLKYGKI